jgi:hypothetical protein
MAHLSRFILRHSGAAKKPYNDAKSFEACYEEIGYRTICGPWRFEVEAIVRSGKPTTSFAGGA